MKNFILVAAGLLLCLLVSGQELSLSTNVLDYANLGTLNAELSCGVARHWTVAAGVRYNPFRYGEGDGEKANCQRSFELGARYWPWHIYSGWWMSGHMRGQEYNVGGIRSSESVEGERYGGGLSMGYTYMIGRHFNLDVGAGFWAGYDIYTSYRCPHCGRIVDSGRKIFILPNDFLLSFAYIF